MLKIIERLLMMPNSKAPKALDAFFRKNVFSTDIVLLYRNDTELMLLNSYFNSWLHQASEDFDLFFAKRSYDWNTKKKIVGSEFPFLIYKAYLSERLRKKIPTILKVYICDGVYHYFFSDS